MAEKSPSVYDFDTDVVDATVLICVLPQRYVRINGKLYHPTKKRVMHEDSKTTIEWDNDNAEVWVPPNIATALTIQSENDLANNIRPIATIIETKDTRVKETPAEEKEIVEVETPAEEEKTVETVAPLRRRRDAAMGDIPSEG